MFRASNGLYVSDCKQRGVRVSRTESGYVGLVELGPEVVQAIEEYSLYKRGLWESQEGVLINNPKGSDRINVFDPLYAKFGDFHVGQVGTPELIEYFDRWAEASEEWMEKIWNGKTQKNLSGGELSWSDVRPKSS